MSQKNEIKYELKNLKTGSLINYDYNVNRKRGGERISTSFCMDSGPIGLTHIFDLDKNNITPDKRVERNTSTSTSQTVSSAAAPTPPRIPESNPPLANAQRVEGHVEASTAVSNTLASLQPARAPTGGLFPKRSYINHQSPPPPPAAVDKCKTYANIVSTDRQWRPVKQSDEWILAQRKRHRNRLSTLEGKAKNSSNEKFKAADIRVPLFINNVDKGTSETDISAYIMNKTQIRVDLQKIKSKVQKQYNAYKMYVPNAKLAFFLDDSLWPEGVIVRKFVEFKQKYDGQQQRP